MRAATSCGQVPWRLPMTILVSRWLAQQPSRLRNEPGHLGGILGVGLPEFGSRVLFLSSRQPDTDAETTGHHYSGGPRSDPHHMGPK